MKSIKLCLGILYLIIPSVWANSEPPCGVKGSVEDRIADCRTTRNSNSGAVATLVTRERTTLKEVWMDDTGLLWGDLRDEKKLNWYEAKAACQKVSAAEGWIGEKVWRLPTPKEFAHIGARDQSYMNDALGTKIVGNEIFELFPKLNELKFQWLWSSSSEGLSGIDGLPAAWGFMTYRGTVGPGIAGRPGDFVLCVAR